MTYEHILVREAGAVCWITLNRPKANALSLALMQELGHAVEVADTAPQVRAIVLYGGEGKFFSAGADLPTLQPTLKEPTVEGSFISEGLKTVNRLAACTTPTLAVVNGVALGGGCELCLACHLRIAADTAHFGQPEIRLGLVPGWGGVHRLPRLIGEAHAYEWLLTGNTYSAAHAHAVGLVQMVVAADTLTARAQELAEQLAAQPRVATQALLTALQKRAIEPAQGPALEKQAFETASRSEDAQEGLAAFIEKRPPVFSGQ